MPARSGESVAVGASAIAPARINAAAGDAGGDDEDHGRAEPPPAKSRLNAHAHLHQLDERGAGGAGDTPPGGR